MEQLICNLIESWNRIINQANIETTMSAIAQIQIAQVAVVITLLSISIAVSKDKIFGLQIKDLLSIAGDGKFRSFNIYVFAQITMIVVSVIGLLCREYTLLIAAFILSVIASVWISLIYLPVITINERKAIEIIKKAASGEKTKVNKDKVMDALGRIALQLMCKQSIEKLTAGLKSDEKSRVLGLLFDKIIERARSVSKQTSRNDMQVLCDYADGLIYIEDKEILTNKKARIIMIISATVCRVAKYESLEDTEASSVAPIVSGLIKYLGLRENESAEEIAMISICRIVKYSVEDGSTDLLKMCRDEFAQRWGYFGEQRNNLRHLTFFELSRYLYYFVCLDKSIPAQHIEMVKEFLDDNETLDPHQRTMAWKVMLKSLIEEMPIDIDAYAYAFYDKNDWEYSILNIARNVILDESSLFDWWIKCRIVSDQPVFNVKANQILDKYKCDMLSALSKYCDDNTKRYDTSKSVGDLARLLDIDWAVNVDVEKHLFDLKNEFAKELRTPSTSVQDEQLRILDCRITIALKEKMKETWLASEMSDTAENNATRIMNLWQELPSNKDDYLNNAEKHISEIMNDSIISNVQYYIDNSCISIINPKTTDANAFLDGLQQICPKYYSQPIARYLESMQIYDKTIVDNISDIEKKCTCIGTNVVGQGMFIGENAISIKWSIMGVESRRLSETEIEEKVSSYLREDGSYYYCGVYGDYNQAYNYVEKTHIVTTTQYFLSVDIDKDNCIIVDLWGNLQRRRDRR